ncbi:SRPBCC family protein [Pseudalkalibacillus berkeleyi]|uniref:SRPBCC family protein n=1 Tax=Pseudalkalibacillus berkeleyi TaxID=1069813 RepID=A0ABS9GUA6_9BACL|nr:SRPBCC family protein [Pseudalkalibacillus berkeleyi]MCF6136423.1 SRPBCC family protein [Pseudalkalibacillus berkeleyi]
MNNRTFVYATYIASTPEKIWEALTSGEFTKQYFFGHRVVSDWTKGAEVTFLRENDEIDIHGTVLKSEPYEMLKYTWLSPKDPVDRVQQMTVTFDLKQMDDTVKLTVIHENLSERDFSNDPNTFQGVNNGWPAIISNLKSLLETGKTLSAVKI